MSRRRWQRSSRATAGGRIVIWDVDWATVSWHTADMHGCDGCSTRGTTTWPPSLPRTLTPLLHEAGFADVTADGHAFVTNALDPETYGGSLMGTIARYGVEQGAWTP